MLKKLLFSLIFTFLLTAKSDAANLDDLYGNLVSGDNCLYETQTHYYRMRENGQSGRSIYNRFDADPSYFSLKNKLRFSPLKPLELDLRYEQIFPSEYRRTTYDPTDAIALKQDYNLIHFLDYEFNLRYRKENIEFFLNSNRKQQKTKWDLLFYPALPNFFTSINAHYEDIKIGTKYLSKSNTENRISNLDNLLKPLLDNNQLNVETELNFKNGRLQRYSTFDHSSGTFNYQYFHQLRPHLTPKINLRYGLNENLEIESGIQYTTPFKYNFEYKRFNPTLTTQFLNGTYQFTDNYKIPMRLKYRHKRNIQIDLSSDFTLTDQRLDYWTKATTDVVTTYPSKQFKYYNFKPTLTLSYLNDKGKDPVKTKLSSLTKTLLQKEQFLIEFMYEKDITTLKKNQNNGAQNIINPYNLFLYPTDFFVTGTEYSIFSAGNTSTTAANTDLQNYHFLNTSFIYGINDSFNVGFKAGICTGSAMHHFALNDNALYRYYRVEPYYFINLMSDWNITKNSLVSFKSHIVPRYKTYYESTDPQVFEVKTKYFETSLSIKILF